MPEPATPDRSDAIPGRTDAAASRRTFLKAAGAGVAGAALATLGTPVPAMGAARGRAPRWSPDPWGRLEAVADGCWALVSTPLAGGAESRRTLCNGGLIAGRDGVMAVEAFASVEGAAWLADEALRLTGMRPTHVVLTHYHGDHVSGGAGYLLGGEVPRLMATRTTRRLMAEQEAALPDDRAEARPLLMPDVVLPDAVLPDAGEHTTVDLGGRVVRLTPRRGHTPSDLVIETDSVIFPGDLIWNGMFPNYMDAIPSELAGHVRALRSQGADLYVSGHGELASTADLDRYIDLLDHVEAAARRAIADGRPLTEAAAEYVVPAALGNWHMFSPRYPAVAFSAWARELTG